MPVTPSKPVPKSDALPAYVRDDLASVGVTRQGFDGLDFKYRLTILVLYVKLKGISIRSKPAWDYINNITRVSIGAIDFNAVDLAALKAALTAERTFADPWGDSWQSRELRLRYSLHFKHDVAWGKMVSVHIDPRGLYTAPGASRKIEAIVTGIPHVVCYFHYQRVKEIRDALLREGWDSEPLTGIAERR